jgi:hypothetical protein
MTALTPEQTPPSEVVEEQQEQSQPDTPVEEVLDGSDLPGLDELEGDEPEAELPNRDTPEFKAFADQFKQYVGVDLTDALKRYEDVAKLHEETLAMRSEVAAVEARRSLQNAWSVNDAEFDRRLAVINTYAEKYPDAVAKYDTIDGLQILYDKLSKRKTNKPAAGAGASTPAPSAKRYKQSELQKLMTSDPASYKAQQAEIAQAYQDGRVDP